MGDPTNLDDVYLTSRQATDAWQQRHAVGTLDPPASSLALGTLTAPDRLTSQRGTDDTLAPALSPSSGTFASPPPLQTGLQALGRVGKQLGEAIKPGVVTAAKALGLDDTQAETAATGLVEFLAGLPAEDSGDTSAGLQTGLAALPGIGLAMKGVKVGKKAVASFRTSKGSTYIVHEDGTTTRYKAARPEHPGDSGLKPTSESTFYVDESALQLLSEIQAKGAHKRIIERLPDGRWGVKYVDGPSAGKFERRTVVSASETPAIGLYPVELWNGGSAVHFGNKITEINLGSATPPEFVSTLDEAQRARLAEAETNFRKNFSELLTTQRRGVRSDAQVTADSLRPEAIQLEAFLNLPPGSILADADVVKIKRLFKDLAEPVRVLAHHLVENPRDDQAFLSLLEQLPTVRDGLIKIAGVYAETGRSQRLLHEKLPTGGKAPSTTEERIRISDPYIQQWLAFFKEQDALEKSGAPAMSREKFVRILASMQSPEELVQAAKRLSRPSAWDMFLEYWINGLLSGPQTHVVNTLSNIATQAWGIPERAVAALLSPSVRPSEATVMLGAVKDSIGDAWRLAWRAFKEEESQLGLAKLEGPQRAITADALELTGLPGRAVDFLGHAIRLPGRALLASDDFFKAIAYRAELRALARRESLRAVHEAGLTGRQAAQRMRAIETRLLADPPEHLQQAAQEYATYVTFTKELGETGAKIQLALTTPLGRVLAPFVRTPTNIFKFAGERTPFALLSRAVREEIQAGGERRALALAKIALGSMTMGYLASLAAEGLVTGGGPKDKVLREQLALTGWQPYSIRIGDTYYSYARVEPFGSLIGLAADLADLLGQLPQQEAEELAAAAVVAFSRNVSNKTFLKGLAGSLNAIMSQDIDVVRAFFEKEVPTLLPYSSALAQGTRALDPVQREVNALVDAVKARLPGYSETLPPHRDLFGRPVLFQGGLGPDLVSPLYSSQAISDPVAQELAAQQIPIGRPSWQIQRVPLDPWEYDAYVQLAGAKPILNGKTLHQRLEELFQSDLYKRATSGPEGGKWQLIRTLVSAYRERAAVMLETGQGVQEHLGTTFPELSAKIRAQRLARARSFQPQEGS